ncbi:MAG: hypothetical protein SO122_05230 [Eubacteriales bacterium]|nr:hypothetical protein [Eubacteriales bacterium]
MKTPSTLRPVKAVRNYLLVNACTSEKLQGIADEAREALPDCFDGECPVFRFCFRYYAPYEKAFNELRRIRFEARNHTRFKEEYNGYIAVDVSEWIGHEEEFYFDIFLKFLSDQKDHWRYIFYTEDTCVRETRKLAELLFGYFTVVPIVNEPALEPGSSIKEALKEKDILISNETSVLLEELCERRFMNRDTIIGMLEDIRLSTNRHMIPNSVVTDYLKSGDGIHRLLLTDRQCAELDELIESISEGRLKNVESI